MPQGTPRVPRINTPNERAIQKGNARFKEIMKSVSQLRTLTVTASIQEQIDGLLAERDSIIKDRRARLPQRADELAKAGYVAPKPSLLIPIPGEG